ncbi:MAG TPA: T9SS type A sorting domain-containing protein [Flavisolibacter sp.]|jgi:uncharacterized delta-60 repeat protein
MRNIFTLLLLLAVLSSNAQLDGSPDPGFGTHGLVATLDAGPTAYHTRQKVILTGNGKILQSFLSAVNSSSPDFGIARYNRDGTLDGSFGTNGMVRTDFGGTDIPGTMAVQKDGKIVLVGRSIAPDLSETFAVARYNSNGTPDSSFDGDGRLTTSIGISGSGFAGCLQDDGKIVVGGYVRSGGYLSFALVRFNTDGTPDNTFGSNGIVITDMADAVDGWDEIQAIALQPDGRIVAAGYTNNAGMAGPLTMDFAIARYNADGTPDDSFGDHGKVITPVEGFSTEIKSLIVQPDGKIIAAGSGHGNGSDMVLVRYTASGGLDNSFNGNGIVITNTVNDRSEEIHDMVLQPDGKILAAGYTDYGYATDHDFMVVRYNTNGTLDGSFGTGGIRIIDFGHNDTGASLALQDGSRLIVSGTSANRLALVRLLNSAIILPVSLTTFTAEKRGSSVQLTWQTASEISAGFFELERSADGVNFTSIGTVAASGNSSSVRNYSFTDAQPFNTNFYRLRIINSDRSANYSRIVTVRFGSAGITLQAFPNPVKNSLNIQFTAPAGQVKLQVLDVSGRMMKMIELKSTGSALTTSIDMSGFRPGAYVIRMNEQSIRVVKE